jgi:hypothetical protein
MSFKKGDVVRCVDPGANDVTTGETYVVITSSFLEEEWVSLIDDTERIHEMFARRFVIANNKELI